jgi:regulator of sirC expression with transglutaminase-like and TPR domain
MINQKEFKALINLLDDPDEEIFKHVQGKLLSFGHDIIPVLENVWEMGDPFNHLVQTRIESIIHKIQFDKIVLEFKNWASGNDQDLLTGAILVAKYQYPDLNEERVKNKIEQINRDVWLELNDHLTALEKIRILNHIIFSVHGFSGNTLNFHAPQNCFISQVIETKKGNPVSLSILYAIVAQGLHIPVFGVNLPQHFVLAFADKDFDDDLSKAEQSDILFYINPFSKGSVFSKSEIDSFLKQLNVEPSEKYYSPCSNVEFVKRLLQTLKYCLDKNGFSSQKDELNELIDLL